MSTHSAPPRGAKLRILYLIDGLGPGGAQTHLAALATGLSKERFAPEIVCLDERRSLGERLFEQGFPISALGLSRIYEPSAFAAFARLVRRMRADRPDVLHTYLSSANLFGGAAARAAGVPGLVATRRDTGFGDSRAMARGLAITSGWARKVVAVSRDAARVARERDGVKEERLVVIPNGIDLVRFSPRGRRQAVRESLGVDPDVPLLLTVSHLTPIKGIDLLLEAAPLVKAVAPRATFLVTGDGGEQERLQKRIAALGLADDFRLLGVRHDVPDLLEAADLFVLPSRSEGQPNALMEAMAMGLPAVAARVGGVPEVMEDGREGLLVDPEDPKALAAACLAMLAPELGRRLGDAAGARVRRDFDLHAMIRRYEALYEEVAASSRRRERS